MKRYNVVRYGVNFLFFVIFLGGCASTGKITTTVPMTVKLSTYKTMLLDISSQIYKSTAEVAQLESMTIAKLREKGLFEKIIGGSSSPAAQADLRLNAKIVSLRRVSSASRQRYGALAGRAGIDVEVELFDLKESKILGTFVAQGSSSGGSVLAGTTDQAIERAVEQIVEFIQRSM